MKKTGSQIIVEALRKEGVDVIFNYPRNRVSNERSFAKNQLAQKKTADFQEIPSMVPLHEVVSRFILDPSPFYILASNIVESIAEGYRPDRPITPPYRLSTALEDETDATESSL